MTEKKARELLEENGYQIIKSRKVNTSYEDEGGYMIVNAKENGCVAGSRYELTIEDVIEWAEENL